MRLLLLGGTEFVGRAVAEAALERGWEVTVFHRGTHAAPEGARVLHGDRTAEGGLAALAEGEWDAVVDTWSAAPSVVRDSARLLAGRVGRYAYVSSRSVYAYPTPAGADESAPLVEGSPDDGEMPYAESKRGGELAALDAFGDRALLVRAGLIVGPYENIGRLPWWLDRIARGGTVLAPGPRDLSVQFIDVRDLATWTLDAVAAGLGGPYDLVGPRGHSTMGELLEACAKATGAEPELRWTTPEAIAAAGIAPWVQLPFWVPPGELYDAVHGADVGKALAAGLRCRPAAETVADTWEWLRSIGGVAPRRPDRPAVGLDPELEAAALAG
ncbi:NAD-dependent epimerase/dehydratase family protein [Kitasatospora purpeofusca]|uniref:NAD-dependent epimerase/dehydratase family protein n=1 Tax=Kitasatospora purpeofusca TaxID=67352 RepID=UPI002250BB56|nr:NAD-dependent epimerase/dehydratase family protein [Kitasatospora purpeofusca]MCX4758547.1 NAD-dependent epimerase/dehydratase family protein [Kitasatospora purpeofusca]WSR31010.1 NAD-dependent epimerase/dehydratase family protein [Kitasatospora purpeofusca]WSR39044.1 NAD-dependent epimerase/dehydratase family protein [Kitasatospora purpeofusca]